MSATSTHASRLISFLVVMAIFWTVIVSWYSQKPSDNALYKIENSEFSTSNSWKHLSKITQFPHYTGSVEHLNVRNYLVDELKKLGLAVEIQNTLALSSKYLVASNVSNVIAHLPATTQPANPKALLLMSHYDSANGYSPGAGDAGSGVAVILEAVRAFLASDLNHSNDIYVLFSDAEEQGLLGAQGFISDHPLAAKIGLVLNFEARGSGGASFTLLETNQGNEQLVQGLVTANVDHPTANSLMYSIYKMLPNDTDLSVFREQADINGLNFAFIDDHFDYHTAQDTVERLDPSSLNHQISYISALLPYFSNVDLQKLSSNQDVVYFNFSNLALFDYPFSWVLPMAVLVALVFIMMSINAIKKQQLAAKSIVIALIPFIVNLLIALLIGIGGWQFLVWLYPQFHDIPQGFTYSGHYIITTAILLTLGFTIWTYQIMVKRFANIKIVEWFMPIIAVWVLVNILIAVYLTGAGFFIILAIAPLAIFGNLMRYRATADRQAITYTLFSLPGLIIISPLIPVLVIGLGLSSLVIATLFTTLLLMTLLPILLVIKGIRSVQLFCLAGAFISFAGIYLNNDYAVERKKPSSINYLYDTASEQAMLFSYNLHLDEFTAKYFTSSNTDTSPLTGLLASRTNRAPRYVTTTQALAISPSKVTANKSEDENGLTHLLVRIEPNRPLNAIQIITDETINLFALEINNKAFEIIESRKRDSSVMQYVVTDQQPIELSIKYQSEFPATLRLVEISRDLAQRWSEFSPRPEDIMPSPFRLTDAIIISQPITPNE